MPTIAETFYLRNTSVTTNIWRLQEALGAANDQTTRVGFDNGAETLRVRPGVVYNPSGGPFNELPAVGGAAKNEGWRLLDADLDSTATAKRTVQPGTINVRVFCGSISAAHNATLHAIIYRRTSGGTLTELARGNSPSTLLTATNVMLTAPITVPAGGWLFEADEEIQLELYIQSTSGAANLLQQVIINVNDPNATNASRIEFPSPGIRTKYLRSHSVAVSFATQRIRATRRRTTTALLSVVTAFSRRETLRRSFSGAVGLAVARVRGIRRARSVNVALVGDQDRRTRLALRVGAIALVPDAGVRLRTAAKSAAVALGSAFARREVLRRSFSAILLLGPTFARLSLLKRAFAGSIALRAQGRVDMGFEVLSRIVGGGTTIVRKILNLTVDE